MNAKSKPKPPTIDPWVKALQYQPTAKRLARILSMIDGIIEPRTFLAAAVGKFCNLPEGEQMKEIAEVMLFQMREERKTTLKEDDDGEIFLYRQD